MFHDAVFVYRPGRIDDDGGDLEHEANDDADDPLTAFVCPFWWRVRPQNCNRIYNTRFDSPLKSKLSFRASKLGTLFIWKELPTLFWKEMYTSAESREGE